MSKAPLQLSKVTDSFLAAFDRAHNEHNSNLSIEQYSAVMGYGVAFTARLRAHLESKGIL